MLPAAFWEGVTAFNQEEFYACHDILEALWLEAAVLDRNFYQGILQIAVACYHLGNGNWQGGVTLLGEGIRRLYNYQPDWEEVDVVQLVTDSQELLENLQLSGVDGLAQLQLVKFPKIVRQYD
jgi:predicted metal-dependent hydrolase